MVVILHATSYGVRMSDMTMNSEITKFLIVILHQFSIVAVNCFVLVSAYFLCDKKIEINIEQLKKFYNRLVSRWIQVVTYSAGVYLVLCVIKKSYCEFNMKTLIRQCLPILTGQYWFVTCYMLMIVCVPFINIFIQQINQKEYQLFLFILIVVFCGIPTINIFGDNFGVKNGYSLLWFLCLYFCSGYIKKYNVKISRILSGSGYIIICFITAVIIKICDYMNIMDSSIVHHVIGVTEYYNSILVFIASILIFLFILSSSKNYGKVRGRIISEISKLSFGVYLLHENNQFRTILWNDIVKLKYYAIKGDVSLLLRLFQSIIVIFIAGVAIEYLRYNIMRILKNKIGLFL